jgi:hypothetical protein
MAKERILKDIAKYRPPGRRTWFANLEPAAQKTAIEVRALWQSGECDHSIRTLHAYFRGSLGAVVGIATLTIWLDDKKATTPDP